MKQVLFFGFFIFFITACSFDIGKMSKRRLEKVSNRAIASYFFRMDTMNLNRGYLKGFTLSGDSDSTWFFYPDLLYRADFLGYEFSCADTLNVRSLSPDNDTIQGIEFTAFPNGRNSIFTGDTIVAFRQAHSIYAFSPLLKSRKKNMYLIQFYSLSLIRTGFPQPQQEDTLIPPLYSTMYTSDEWFIEYELRGRKIEPTGKIYDASGTCSAIGIYFSLLTYYGCAVPAPSKRLWCYGDYVGAERDSMLNENEKRYPGSKLRSLIRDRERDSLRLIEGLPKL